MSLSAYDFPTEKITIQNVTGKEPVVVEVRGLTARDFSVLIDDYESIMRLVFEQVDFSSEKTAVRDLMNQAPDFLAAAIALAAEEPGQAHIVARLPIVTQLELAAAVYRLTMPEGYKKAAKKIKAALKRLTL